MIHRIIDAIAFRAWDLCPDLAPVEVRILVRRLYVRLPLPDHLLGLYFRQLCKSASPRAMRYLETRYPAVIFLWRMGCAADVKELAQ